MSANRKFTTYALLASSVLLVAPICQVASASVTPYQAAVLSHSPVVYFTMDDTAGTTATDNSGNGHNGTYGVAYGTVGTPAVTLGVSSASPALNTAIGVSGVHGDQFDPIKLTDVAALNAIGTGAFTIQYWFNTSDVTNREDLIDFRGTSPANDLSMQVNNGAGGGISVFNNSGTAVIPASSTAGDITANTWNMITLTRDATGNTALYIDGNSVATGTNTQTLDTGATGALAIGNKVSGTAHLLLGSLDEFAFYNSVLTATDVSTLYALGVPVPEPTSLGVLALGAMGMLARRRRR
jgi:hypothetical protein